MVEISPQAKQKPDFASNLIGFLFAIGFLIWAVWALITTVQDAYRDFAEPNWRIVSTKK
ncbi:MAG TPA: hypothetical protein VNM40_01025 [Candidatus Paceibacterota bacterium]|nr:hypothetical protein [Candidatus Paceibacterota bacterium]